MIPPLPIPLPSRETALESAETRESRAFRRRLPAFYVPARSAPVDTWPGREGCARGTTPAPTLPIPAPDHDAHVRTHREYLASASRVPADKQTLQTINTAIDAARAAGASVASEGLQWPLPRETAIAGRDAIAARLERDAHTAGAPVPAYDIGARRAARWATDAGRAALPAPRDPCDQLRGHASRARDWTPMASDAAAWHASYRAAYRAAITKNASKLDAHTAAIAACGPAPAPYDDCSAIGAAVRPEHSPHGIHCPASLGTSDASKRAARGEPVAWAPDTTAYRATHRAGLADAVRAAPSNRAARDPYHALRAACLRDGVPVPPLASLRSNT